MGSWGVRSRRRLAPPPGPDGEPAPPPRRRTVAELAEPPARRAARRRQGAARAGRDRAPSPQFPARDREMPGKRGGRGGPAPPPQKRDSRVPAHLAPGASLRPDRGTPDGARPKAPRVETRERVFLEDSEWEACLGEPLDQVTPFDVLGQGGLLTHGGARSASAVAINGTQALVVRRKDFLPLFVKQRAQLLHRADMVRMLKVPLSQRSAKSDKQLAYMMQANSLLERFDPRIRVELCRSMRMVTREAGDVIYRQGDAADAMYIIVQGMVSLHIKPFKADYKEKYSSDYIGRFGPLTTILTEGGTFGETAMVRGVHRPHTVVAHEPTKLAAVSSSALNILLQKLEAEERLSQAQYLRKVPGIKDWDSVRLSQLSQLFVLERFRRGQVISRQGTVTENVAIVRRGQVQVRCRLDGSVGQYLRAAPREGRDKDAPAYLKNLDRAAIAAAVKVAEDADALAARDPKKRRVRWLDLGILGPGQFVGDIPIILGINSPFQIEAVTDCALHVADPDDILDAVASDDRALQAMRKSALDKLHFFAKRKLDTVRTISDMNTAGLMEKARELPALFAERRRGRDPGPRAGESTLPAIASPARGRAGGPRGEDAPLPELVPRVTAGAWDGDEGSPLLASVADVVEAAREWGRASLGGGAGGEGAPGAERSMGDMWRERREHARAPGPAAPETPGGPPGGAHARVWHGLQVDDSTLRLGVPVSNAGRATQSSLEKSLVSLRPGKKLTGSPGLHPGGAGRAPGHPYRGLVSEMMAHVQDVSAMGPGRGF